MARLFVRNLPRSLPAVSSTRFSEDGDGGRGSATTPGYISGDYAMWRARKNFRHSRESFRSNDFGAKLFRFQINF